MRHPTSGLSEDDLSRLTGSSSPTCSSNNNNNSPSSSSSSSPTSDHKQNIVNDESYESVNDQYHHKQNKNSPQRQTFNLSNRQQSTSRFTSTYLPEFISPLDWQKSRKRKERLDSTSTSTQERKLQRSNSEELLTQESPSISFCNENLAKLKHLDDQKGADNKTLGDIKAPDVIRRVCSEDFQKSSSYAAYAQEFNDNSDNRNEAKTHKQRKSLSDENNAALANRHNQTETSTCASVWAIGQPTKDMSRRARTETSPARSQRFSPVRSSNGSISSKQRDSDDSECEHERRRSSERFCKTRAPPGRKASGVSKKSGNSAKYLSGKRGDESAYKYDLSALKCERRGFVSKKLNSFSQNNAYVASSASISDHNDNNLIDFNSQQNQLKKAATTVASGEAPTRYKPQSTDYITAQEALPWERTVPEDQQPILSRRYSAVRNHPVENMETVAKFTEVMLYPHQTSKLDHVRQLDDDFDESKDIYRAFTSTESMRKRDIMDAVTPAIISFHSPIERLKQVNKRLTSLKKKLAHLEQSFEERMGYRPSQAERINDKYMKNVLAELSKLRKEKHELKSEPIGPIKIIGTDREEKLENMKSSLEEIEKDLSQKRFDDKRSEVLDELNAEQLIQEKTAIQHGLLHFEQLYGRPTTKDERDAARPLYSRYRLLKRMVIKKSQGVLVSCTSELPTILENEALGSLPNLNSSNNSTETANTPSDSVAPNLSTSDDSTTTTTPGGPVTATANVNETNENISDLSIDQLWEQLDKTREEKRLLKRTIREYETVFEEQNGRKMLKNDRRTIEETYAQYKEKKAKTRLLQALIKKHIKR